PAGTTHTEIMRAPISMRSIYVSRLALPSGRPEPGRIAPDRVRTIRVAPLLRELILHISRIGALDRRRPEQARLVGVLLDQLAAAPDESLALRSPRDPRARRLADLITGELDGSAHALGSRGVTSIAALARKAGASLRTLERCFVTETGASVGEW